MSQGEKKQSTLKSNWKVFMKKRWSLPVLYLACAAIIVSTVVVLQMPNDQDVANVTDETVEQSKPEWVQDPSGKVTEVNQSMETMSMPVVDPNAIVINRSFYDQSASAEEQQAALIVVNQNYYPNQGIDIVQDGESFDVLAAMSGTVTVVQEDPFIGNAIEIEHTDGLVTRYHSVADISVQVGDEVKQGQPIAIAGISELNVEAGTHLHFEVLKDNEAVNPVSFIGE